MGETLELRPPNENEGEWISIDDNAILHAKLLAAQKVKMPYTDKDTGEDVYKIEFSFEVTEDGTFRGRKLKGATSTNFANHSKCRLYQWVKTFLGVTELPEGYKLDLDDLRDVEVFVQVNRTEKPSTKNPGEMFVNNMVIDVRPLRESVPQGSAMANVSAPADFGEEPF